MRRASRSNSCADGGAGLGDRVRARTRFHGGVRRFSFRVRWEGRLPNRRASRDAERPLLGGAIDAAQGLFLEITPPMTHLFALIPE